MKSISLLCAVVAALSAPLQIAAENRLAAVQLGPRPFYLLDRMAPGPLKQVLQQCAAKRQIYRPVDFSIGHRGAPLQFPEHTAESYRAAHRMGAGLLECDVTFTADGELVCRHAQCDLHTTTNILLTPLADRCAEPFSPARHDAAGKLLSPASARCCASALTLAEFKSLAGKMDAADPGATSAQDYVGGTADFRTDLYASGGTLLSHADSIALFARLGARFTPELKRVTDGFGSSGLSQRTYARKMIQEYVAAGVDPQAVFAQSFDLDDVLLWVDEYPEFGAQAVLLDDLRSNFDTLPPSLEQLRALKRSGVNILAPPMQALLTTDASNKIVPSLYARRARQADLELIAWSLERSGRIVEDVLEAGGSFYYQSTLPALSGDGDILATVDVLARDVGIIGLFSDWPATTTFYANCIEPGRLGGRRGDLDHD